MTSKFQDERAEKEKDFFEYLLKFPGARKAKPGVLVPTPNGFFHARGLHKLVDGLPDDAQHYLEFCNEKEVRRSLDIKNAHDYILKRRIDAISNSPRLTRSIIRVKSEWESRGRNWSITEHYNKLNSDAQDYIHSLSKSNRKVFKKLAYGRVPLPQPNGLCFRSLVGDVVMVSDTLHYFFYFFTMASLGYFYKIDIHQRCAALLIALRIMSGAETTDFDIDPREKLPTKIKSELLQDVGWMMQFTFAHEFAHFRLGHLDTTPASDDDKVKFSHNLEFEADINAVSFHGLKNWRTRKLIWAAHQVFLGFHALHRVGMTRNDFPDFSLSRTHPTPSDRINALEQLSVRNKVISRDILDDAIEATNRIVDILLNSIEHDADLLLRYGSVYVPGFDVGNLRDRIDY